MCFDLLLLDSTLYSSSIYTLKFGFRRKGIISLNSPTHRLKCVDLWPLSNCWMFWLLFWKNMIKIMLKNSEQQVWNIERAKKNTLNNNNNRVNRFCFFFVRFQRTTRQSRYSVCLVSFGSVRFGSIVSSTSSLGVLAFSLRMENRELNIKINARLITNNTMYLFTKRPVSTFGSRIIFDPSMMPFSFIDVPSWSSLQ